MSQYICRGAPSFFVDALLNRKFHTSQISNCEEFVPITHSARKKMVPVRHIFRTNISLCEKCERRQMS